MFTTRAAKAPARAVAAHATPRVSKRHVASMLAGISLSSAGSAIALIPDDDDEEMVNKAKANRAARLKEV